MLIDQRVFDPQGASLPNAVRLGRAYDAERMAGELARFTAGSGNVFSPANGRRVLPLRSLDGDPYRTSTGGPGIGTFRDTPWLGQLPYFGEILAGLPGPVRGVRLWAAAPRSRTRDMRTPKIGPPWGFCRLHLPVAAGAGSRCLFVGESQHWAPGSLWFAASWRSHTIVNRDVSDLVHLIVDLFHTAETEDLFPAGFRPGPGGVLGLRRRPEVPLSPAQARPFMARFRLPELFCNWEHPGHRIRSGMSGADIDAAIDVHRGALALVLAGRPFCGLEHLGDGEFRLQGWSDERTIQVTSVPRPAAVLRVREGTSSYVSCLPLR
ncbi:hypothetical protein [Streptomyces sp. NBC_00096]|uniref:hypothetical protein n=1 Tax=Streptomyces sp. NBC_00096 TaxID=2975650 RepID=UPI003251942E